MLHTAASGRASSRAPSDCKRAPATVSHVSTDGEFEGYASLFGVMDLCRDVVAPGAFRDTLKGRARNPVRMLWQHDPAEPIGEWLSIVEDARGLKVKGRLDLSVARAREALSLLRSGALDGLSIGFRTELATKDGSGGRVLRKIDLWEISLVTFPAMLQARVTSVKRARPDFSIKPGSLAAHRTDLHVAWLRAKSNAAALRFQMELKRMAEARYAPSQPRVAAGLALSAPRPCA